MGELPFRVQTALHPDHLWIWRKAVYVDENQRTWLPISIKVQPLRGRAGQGSMGVTIPGQPLGAKDVPGCARLPGAPQVRRQGGAEGLICSGRPAGRTDETSLSWALRRSSSPGQERGWGKDM